jgi:methionyl-tRNA formyltransferase
MKFVFFGTSEFSVAILEKLISDFFYPVLVVSQPARPAGRKQVMTEPPIKHVCDTHQLKLVQPERVKDIQQMIADLKPDLIITASYGQIIPDNILSLPVHGALNVHTSLLPLHRGASPIQAAILAGDHETGVTIMKMDAQMDHGDILFQRKTMIEPNDSAVSLHARLANLGADTLTKILPDYISGKMKSIPQNHDKATFTKLIKKDDARLSFMRPVSEVERAVRAYYDWPCAWTMLPNGKRVKILHASAEEGHVDAVPGTLMLQDDHASIACPDGRLVLKLVQVEGKNTTPAAEFARGYHTLNGQACS